jgi:hypothetical protein
MLRFVSLTRSPVSRIRFVTLPLFAALGCSPEMPEDAFPAIADSAGVRLVTSGPRGEWGDGEAWRLVPDLRIGMVDGPPEYMFSQVAALALGPGDTIYVLDQGDKAVTAYDPQGRFVRRFGREGDGPGEFRAPGSMAAGRDGLLVYDWRPRRLTRFSWTGEVVSTVLVEQWTPFGANLRMVGDTAFTLGMTGGQSAPPRPTDGRFWLVRFSTAGAVLDTLIADQGGESVVHRRENSVTVFGAPFARGPRWDVAPDGRVAYGRGDAYVIDLYANAPDVRLVARVRRTEPSLEATEADRSAYREPYQRPSLPEATRRRHAEILETVSYPATWPAYTQLLFDAAGRLWVRRPVHAGESVIPRDVFTPEGVYLGEVTFPGRLNVLLIGDDAVYGVERDELDVPAVVRYRIARP